MKYNNLSYIKLIFLISLVYVCLSTVSFAGTVAYDEIYVDTTAPSITSISIRQTSVNNYAITARVVDYDGDDGALASSEDISKRRYMITNTNTKPTKSDSGWLSSSNITSTLRGYIYAWVMTEDYVGNVAIESRYFGYLDENDEFSYIEEPGGDSPGGDDPYSGTSYENREVYADVYLDYTPPTINAVQVALNDEGDFEISADVHDPILRDGSSASQENVSKRMFLATRSVAKPDENDMGWQSSNVIDTDLEGDIYFWLKTEDNVGNTSIGSGDVVGVDRVPPTGTISIRDTVSIFDGSKAINSRNVILDMTAEDNQTILSDISMALLNEELVTDSIDLDPYWKTFNNTKNWVLSDGDGSKTVYMILKDEAGNATAVPVP